MQHYELMSIYTVKNGLHDYDAELPEYNSTDSVDSDPCAIGTPMEIIKYILKKDLPGYKYGNPFTLNGMYDHAITVACLKMMRRTTPAWMNLRLRATCEGLF